jgi:predicted transcriptional regulator
LFPEQQEVSMKVKEAMHSGVEWCAPDTPIKDISVLMREKDVGAVPIGESDRLIGMVTDRDIVIRGISRGYSLEKLTARDVMTEGIIYCRADDEVEDVIHFMEKKKIRRLPVISKQKRMVGILTLGDLSHAASHELSGELMEAVSAHH